MHQDLLAGNQAVTLRDSIASAQSSVYSSTNTQAGKTEHRHSKSSDSGFEVHSRSSSATGVTIDLRALHLKGTNVFSNGRYDGRHGKPPRTTTVRDHRPWTRARARRGAAARRRTSGPELYGSRQSHRNRSRVTARVAVVLIAGIGGGKAVRTPQLGPLPASRADHGAPPPPSVDTRPAHAGTRPKCRCMQRGDITGIRTTPYAMHHHRPVGSRAYDEDKTHHHQHKPFRGGATISTTRKSTENDHKRRTNHLTRGPGSSVQNSMTAT